MRVLELPSDPYDRGIEHGSELKDQIHSVLADQLENILTSPATVRRGIRTSADLLAFTDQYTDHARSFSEPLWTELEGIARGADLSVSEILFLNLHLEMIDLANAAAPDPVRATDGGCTDIAVRSEKRPGCYLMQTYDVRDFYEASAFVYKYETNEGVRLGGLSFAGTLAANGMNDKRFAVVINKLYGSDSKVGVPYPFIVRAALEQRTPGRSISHIVGADRAGSMHYLCGDQEGLLYPLETTAKKWDLLEVRDGVYCHTNHFLSDRFKDMESRDFRVHNAHTIVRLQRSRQLLARLGCDAAKASYEELLCDEHNHPLGISAVEDDTVRYATVAKSSYDTGTGEASFALGRGTLTPVNLF